MEGRRRGRVDESQKILYLITPISFNNLTVTSVRRIGPLRIQEIFTVVILMGVYGGILLLSDYGRFKIITDSSNLASVRNDRSLHTRFLFTRIFLRIHRRPILRVRILLPC